VEHTSVEGLLARARAEGLPRLDAQVLLAHALGCARTWLHTHPEASVPPSARASFALNCRRRLDGVPVAYLTGLREFHGLSLVVTPDVLDPRPDTEVLVDWALQMLHGPLADRVRPIVADLGTGSGAVALAIGQACPRARLIATDVSPAALAVARRNGQRLGLQVDWRQGDWLAALRGERVDLLVGNPPYVAEGDPHLAALRHEPQLALVSGSQGLDALLHIAATAPRHLQPGGWLLLEHGADQADAVARALHAAGFGEVAHRHDLAGHRRCTGGRQPTRAPD